MFASRYFPDRMFAPRYFAKVGAVPPVVTYFDGLTTSLTLTGAGHLWWFWLLVSLSLIGVGP